MEGSIRAKTQLDSSSRFDTTPACDGRTDTQRTYRASAASRGRNCVVPSLRCQVGWDRRQWHHFSQTLGGLTFHTQLLLRVCYCNAWHYAKHPYHRKEHCKQYYLPLWLMYRLPFELTDSAKLLHFTILGGGSADPPTPLNDATDRRGTIS